MKSHHRIYVDRKCYENLMDHMNKQHTVDLRGEYVDLNLFHSDKWLLDSAVIDRIVKRNGNWDIYLIFAYVLDPFKMIRKKITSCTSLQKAKLSANYMRRLAAKDQRGTLRLDDSSFFNCNN